MHHADGNLLCSIGGGAYANNVGPRNPVGACQCAYGFSLSQPTSSIAANAFEDFGGYCQRTGENCAAASFRETERKLAKARVRRYQFLPGIRVEERIPEVLLRARYSRTSDPSGRNDRASESCSDLAAQWRMVAFCASP